MVITKEQTCHTPYNFKVVTVQKVVPDSTIRVTPTMMIHRREVKIYALKKKREATFKLIQHRQLLALTTDDDRKARSIAEYVDTILMHDLRHLDQEIRALYKEIEDIRNR